MRPATLALLLLAPALLAGCAEDDDAPAKAPIAPRQDAWTFTLPPGKSIEWKLALDKGGVLTYAWSAPRPLSFDFHGDHDDGTDGFVSHEENTLATDKGSFTAPFEGRHGWYWQNKNTQTVALTLTTSGPYAVVGRTGGNAP